MVVVIAVSLIFVAEISRLTAGRRLTDGFGMGSADRPAMFGLGGVAIAGPADQAISPGLAHPRAADVAIANGRNGNNRPSHQATLAA
jgi:hypothetical protein